MNALIRAELLKLRATRTLPGCCSPPSHSSWWPSARTSPPPTRALAFTQEVRYGTIASTFLVEPQRSRVLVAKAVALVTAAVAIAAATLLVSVALSMALIGAEDGNIATGRQFWQIVAAVFVAMVPYGLRDVL